MINLFLVRYPEMPTKIPKKGSVTFGRSDKNNVVLNERRVSRKHAQIEWLEDAKTYGIKDCKSSNGTYLNGYKLIPGEHYPLNDWDKIRITAAVFTARVVDDPKTIKNEFKELRKHEQLQATEIINIKDIESFHEEAAFSGELSYLCPVELFQMLDAGGKTGILRLNIENHIEGIFTICSGQVIAASMGESYGEDAFYEILRYNTGNFAFKPQEIITDEPQIVASTTSLLMEGCRMLDEETREDLVSDG